jgi:ubiquinone/menaquinone biosynthesis C-methylase UbiE
LLPPEPACVVEVGAGTGKLTDRIVERGIDLDLDLDVVEPDERMLDLVRERHPAIRTHVANAAALPLADSSVDAVLVADAWHWFPKAEAAAEAERVLKPNGWLSTVWNLVAPQQGWEWDLHGLDPDRNVAGEGEQEPLVVLGLTRGHAERCSFPWTWWVTPQAWRGFQSTVSRIALLPTDERDAVLDEAEQIVTAACVAAGRESVPLHHEAVCFRWRPNA